MLNVIREKKIKEYVWHISILDSKKGKTYYNNSSLLPQTLGEMAGGRPLAFNSQQQPFQLHL